MGYAFGIFLIFLTWTLLSVGITLLAVLIFMKAFKKIFK